MDLTSAFNSIEDKIYEQDAKMTNDEASVLKENLENPEAMCYYALGLLMNSSCRIHHIFGFKEYDDLQLEAFSLLEKSMKRGSPNAYYWMAEIKIGLFGKFPMNLDGAKELYEKYYEITNDDITKRKVIDKWDQFLKDRVERFNNIMFTEQYKAINPSNVDTSSHDEAYYESLSENNDDEE